MRCTGAFNRLRFHHHIHIRNQLISGGHVRHNTFVQRHDGEGEKEEELISDPPSLNINSSAEGLLDTWTLDKQHRWLLREDLSVDARQAARWFQAPLKKENDGIAYYKADILHNFPGYPREPNFDRFLPTEIKRLVDKKEMIILDCREQWEIEKAPFVGPNIFHVDPEELIRFGSFGFWGLFHRHIEELLPEILEPRDSKFAVVSLDGNTAELLCAVLYGHGWNNASVMLGGFQHWRNTVDSSLVEYTDLDKPGEEDESETDTESEEEDDSGTVDRQNEIDRLLAAQLGVDFDGETAENLRKSFESVEKSGDAPKKSSKKSLKKSSKARSKKSFADRILSGEINIEDYR